MSASTHWIVVPVVLPLVAAALALLAGPRRPGLQAALSVLTVGALAAAALALLRLAATGEVGVYLVGNWRAPFGIVLAVDRLSATMLLLTAVLAAGALAYALLEGSDRPRAARTEGGGAPAAPPKHAYFHPLFLLQLMGLNGAFLTGDLFNLFVFFEVLLIASYGLLLHGALDARPGDAPGAPGRRMSASIQYVVFNLAGSSLFLVAVSLIYAVTGTLNMADLAARVPQVAAADRPLLEAGALILLVVFCVKGALLPLNAWLPAAYASAGAPAAALFAVLTKVGVYSVARVFTLVFGPEAGGSAGLADALLVGFGIATVAAGSIGVLAARELPRMAGWFVIGSSGTLLAALGFSDARVTGGALFYLVDSTLAASALLMLVGLLRGATAAAAAGATAADAPAASAAASRPPADATLATCSTTSPQSAPRSPAGAALLGAAFFLVAMMLAGLPPLGGFLGKFMLLSAALDAGGGIAAGGAQAAGGGEPPSAAAAWLVAAVLINGLLGIVALARAGSRVFWKDAARLAAPGRPALLPLAVPLAAALALVPLAAPVARHAGAAAEALHAPQGYVRAVLGAEPASRAVTVSGTTAGAAPGAAR